VRVRRAQGAVTCRSAHSRRCNEPDRPHIGAWIRKMEGLLTMKCPIDGAMLVMTERNGVEIDYCPTCRGVWLDRGELDKIVARAAAEAAPPVPLREPARASAPARDDDRREDWRGDREDRRRHRDDDDDDDRRYGKKRRESFLSDLFDF
jgi:hypothetical protein